MPWRCQVCTAMIPASVQAWKLIGISAPIMKDLFAISLGIDSPADQSLERPDIFGKMLRFFHFTLQKSTADPVQFIGFLRCLEKSLLRISGRTPGRFYQDASHGHKNIHPGTQGLFKTCFILSRNSRLRESPGGIIGRILKVSAARQPGLLRDKVWERC